MDLKCRIPFASVAAFLATAGVAMSAGTNAVNLVWGVFPKGQDIKDVDGNGTSLYREIDGECVAVTRDDWNASGWGIRLLGINTNVWVEGKGWRNPKWMPVTYVLPQSVVNTNGETTVRIFGKTSYVDLDWFGSWETAPDGQIAGATETNWYKRTWASQHAVVLAVHSASNKVCVFSDTPGGTAPAGLCNLQIVEDLYLNGANTGIAMTYNSVHIPVRTASTKAFIGSEVPPWCVWMADFELTEEELANYPAWRVEAAFEARVHPSDKSLDATAFVLR